MQTSLKARTPDPEKGGGTAQMLNGTALCYTAYLVLAQEVMDDKLPLLDPFDEQILNGLMAAWSAGQSPTVGQARGFGSPEMSTTTAQRRIKSLRLRGVITFSQDEKDTRVKYVQPTASVKEYFSALGECVAKASRAPSSRPE